MHCKRNKGIAGIPVMKTRLYEACCGSEMENTNTTVCGALLALPSAQTALSYSPGLLLLKGKRAALLRAHGLELLFLRSV